MKRPRTARKINRTGDIRKDLSQAQLSGVGSVALAFNEAETLIDILVSLALGLLTNTANEVTSRINGVDGKIELAKIRLRELSADQKTMELITATLSETGFKEYKRYRDAVIHARILDAPTGIALGPTKRGKNDEVLLTVSALDGLYDRLVIVRLELIEACNIAARLFSERRWAPAKGVAPAPANPLAHALGKVDPPKRQFEQDIQDCLSRYQEHQKRRLSLPPLPEFPEEPPGPSGLEDYGARQPPPEGLPSDSD